jgi:hypothetical protein
MQAPSSSIVFIADLLAVLPTPIYKPFQITIERQRFQFCNVTLHIVRFLAVFIDGGKPRFNPIY